MFTGVGDVITFEAETHTDAISRDALNVHNYATAWLTSLDSQQNFRTLLKNNENPL